MKRDATAKLTTNNNSFPVRTNPVTSTSFNDRHLPTTGANATSTLTLLLFPANAWPCVADDELKLEPSILKMTFSGDKLVKKFASCS